MKNGDEDIENFEEFSCRIEVDGILTNLTHLRYVAEVLPVDVLADHPPERLDVVHGRPQRVHLARLGDDGGKGIERSVIALVKDYM